MAYSVLNNEQDSYDVIQSVMMRLYGMDKNLFPSDHALSWLKTVVKNEALMKPRKEKATVPLEDAFDLSFKLAAEQLLPTIWTIFRCSGVLQSSPPPPAPRRPLLWRN